jgi:hypothetical protein
MTLLACPRLLVRFLRKRVVDDPGQVDLVLDLAIPEHEVLHDPEVVEVARREGHAILLVDVDEPAQLLVGHVLDRVAERLAQDLQRLAAVGVGEVQRLRPRVHEALHDVGPVLHRRPGREQREDVGDAGDLLELLGGDHALAVAERHDPAHAGLPAEDRVEGAALHRRGHVRHPKVGDLEIALLEAGALERDEEHVGHAGAALHADALALELGERPELGVGLRRHQVSRIAVAEHANRDELRPARGRGEERRRGREREVDLAGEDRGDRVGGALAEQLRDVETLLGEEALRDAHAGHQRRQRALLADDDLVRGDRREGCGRHRQPRRQRSQGHRRS